MKLKNLKRYRKVLRVLIKYGLDDLLAHSSMRNMLPNFLLHKRIQGELSKMTYSRHERIRMALEELGPTFVKFGQILSNRPDLLPKELIDELEKLQDAVPSFAFSDVKDIVETDLGKPIENMFASFDEQPLASASIAQVHRATLYTGEQVVVKVQRPDIADVIETDLDILGELAEIAENNFDSLARYEPVELVKSLRKSMHRELNFLLEANNMMRFTKMFENVEWLHIPVIYTFLSSRRVITMEFIDGVKVNNLEQLRKQNISLHEVAKRGLYLYFEQIFRHGFFHADPHPGNVLVDRSGRIALIDFGMTGTLNRKDKHAFRDFIVALTKGDFTLLVEAIEHLTKNKKIENKEELEYDINVLLDEFPPSTIDERNMGEVVNSLQQIIYKHRLSFPNDFFLLLRTLVILDGVSRILEPSFNTLKYIRQNSLLLIEEKLKPKAILQMVLHTALDAWDFIRVLPGDIKKVIDRIKEGKVIIEVKGLQPLLHTLDVVSNRLAAAIVLAAMIIGSSLIVLSHIPPLWNNIPIIGLIGIIISGIFGLILLISIFRKGKY
jgi:ubiquinone biosynthesis protein